MTEDSPYDEDAVRAFLTLMPQVESVREKGTLILSPVAYTNTIEAKLATQELSWKAPRPARRRNLPYRIDNVACVMIDIDNAMQYALTPKARARLRLHYLFGYQHKEIAALENVSESAVEVSCHRSIINMVKWLEKKRPIGQLEREYKPDQDETYKRKYATFPR